MKADLNEVEINGTIYVRKDSVSDRVSQDTDGKLYVICRCRDAGVHSGYLESQDDLHVNLVNSRRIWYWNGAASLSELAVYGLNPDKTGSKIGAKLDRIQLRQTDVCEIIQCCVAGKKCLEEHAEWRA